MTTLDIRMFDEDSSFMSHIEDVERGTKALELILDGVKDDYKLYTKSYCGVDDDGEEYEEITIHSEMNLTEEDIEHIKDVVYRGVNHYYTNYDF